MNKLFFFVIIGFAMLLSSCSNNKSENSSTNEAEIVSAPSDIDVERIMAYKSVEGSQLTEKDYDFLLDQF